MRKALLPLAAAIMLVGCSDSEELTRLRQENGELKTRIVALEFDKAGLLNELRAREGLTPLPTSVEAEERAADQAARRANARFRQGIADIVDGRVRPEPSR
ncbi:hypothetical protein [Allosphingosinicella sp.]|uniref:hypothetical protein n=1 Tax=Allosphingosinicella sp. TaxID=2823234 RepID=UPI0037851F6D